MSAPLVTAEAAQPATATEGAEPGNAPAAPQQQIIRVHKSGVEPKLQNLVATVNFGCKVDLKTIALRARNAEYNPKRFAAVIMRIREPKTTALIFQSGKMVVTGARTEDDCRQAARKFCKMIQKLEFPAQFKDFKIQNMVASCDVKFPIRLEGLAFAHAPFSSYEPELFPGLIYRMKSPKIVLLIFVSGKVVLTGGKQRIDLYQAFENIYPVLQQFKKGDVAQPGPQPQQQAQPPQGQALPALPAPPPAAPQQQRQLPPLGGFGAPQQHMQYPGGR